MIAGLGNPGTQYSESRHNVGFWFIESLLQAFQVGSLRMDNKFKAETGDFTFEGQKTRVMAPVTFMNLSGQSVVPFAAYYNIPAEQIIVVHDELDLQPGVVRLKSGGGHGGHKGLSDISARLGCADYLRLRIGIGHPGNSRLVTGYVLSRPPKSEQLLIKKGIEKALDVFPLVLRAELAIAMNQLHSQI